MKIVSFNIRREFAEDGENSFHNRQAGILAAVRRERPELIGFQEVLPSAVAWLRENLEDYVVAGCGRGPDLLEEHMILACRRDALQLLGLSTFWLSPTPEEPGSRYEKQSPCPRNCCCFLLREETSGRLFRVYVTHLDHEEPYAREEGLRLILSRMEAENQQMVLPAVLLGDFNAEPGAPELALLKTNPLVRDVTGETGPTFHGFGTGGEKIDYIALSSEFACAGVRLWTDCENGIYLSDHYPVEAEVRFV